MRLIFKQRIFSWFDSYDIYDEQGNTVFTIRGQWSWGKKLELYDALGYCVGTLKQKIFTFMPTFEIYMGDLYVGCIQKEITFFKPSFRIDCNGWHVQGEWWEWNYDIRDHSDRIIACIRKEVWNWSDTYVIDVFDPADSVSAVMIALAIDAEKDIRD